MVHGLKIISNNDVYQLNISTSFDSTSGRLLGCILVHSKNIDYTKSGWFTSKLLYFLDVEII